MPAGACRRAGECGDKVGPRSGLTDNCGSVFPFEQRERVQFRTYLHLVTSSEDHVSQSKLFFPLLRTGPIRNEQGQYFWLDITVKSELDIANKLLFDASAVSGVSSFISIAIVLFKDFSGHAFSLQSEAVSHLLICILFT